MRSSTSCSISTGLLLAVFASAAAAQTPELDALLRRMSASAGVEAAFEERKELSLLAAPLESRGVIYFAAPGRFARFTTDPGFTSLIVSGDEVRLREGADGEELDLTGNPLARVFVENVVVLWSGDHAKLRRLYAAAFKGDAERWELALTPRNDPLARVIASITMRGDADAMREMIVAERDGDLTTTVFRSVRSDRRFAPHELERIFGDGRPLPGEPAEP
jgi:hypothetical protein